MKVKSENRSLVDALEFPALLHDASNNIWLFMTEDSCGFCVKDGKFEATAIRISSSHPWRRYNGQITLENS